MQFRTGIIILATLSLISSVWAISLDDLSNTDASKGLRAALEKSSDSAVGKLGIKDGFLSNPKVKIQLPGVLEQAQSILKMTGQGAAMDELVTSMNHAAESAVPMAKPLLMKAVKSMTVTDAKSILTGGDTSVTDFFRQKTAAQLTSQLKPIVKSVTDKAGLSGKYNAVMGSVAKFGVVPEEQATVESYVTERAIDGLFLMIGEEEKSIRQNPLATGSKAIEQVFGLL